jgi:hypothetical protein
MHWKSSENLWNLLKPGETILIEYSARSTPFIVFYSLIQWAKNNDFEILIDDILDTLYAYKVQLSLAGIDLDLFSDLLVIKESGRVEVGRIVGRMGIRDSAIYWSEYNKIMRPIFERAKRLIINIILGIEKLFVLADSKREILNNINNILSWTGNTKRITFYFINTDLVNTLGIGVLPLLEELASTVINVDKDEGRVKLLITKSINNELDGLEINL